MHIISFWQNSEWDMLVQWDPYSSENQLNCCEVRKLDDDDDDTVKLADDFLEKFHMPD
jgi:hypothetical protein